MFFFQKRQKSRKAAALKPVWGVSAFFEPVRKISGLGGLFKNGMALGEEADFEALTCLPALDLIRNIAFHLPTEPPIYCRCC